MIKKEYLQKRKKITKTIWDFLFLISSIIFVVIIANLRINDYQWRFLFFWFYLIFYVFIFVFWLLSFRLKLHSYDYHGHEISIYIGFFCAFLLVDDEVVDKDAGSSYGIVFLESDLDGEIVLLKVGTGSFFGSYTLKVGNKILH